MYERSEKKGNTYERKCIKLEKVKENKYEREGIIQNKCEWECMKDE